MQLDNKLQGLKKFFAVFLAVSLLSPAPGYSMRSQGTATAPARLKKLTEALSLTARPTDPSLRSNASRSRLSGAFRSVLRALGLREAKRNRIRSEVRAKDEDKLREVQAYAAWLHRLEDEILAMSDENQEAARVGLARIVLAFMQPEDLGSLYEKDWVKLNKGMLVEHALWRLLAQKSIRSQAIPVARFVEPIIVMPLMMRSRAIFVTVLGRFAKEDKDVREFLQQIIDGKSWGSLVFYDIAKSEAEQALKREEEVGNPATRQEDLDSISRSEVRAEYEPAVLLKLTEAEMAQLITHLNEALEISLTNHMTPTYSTQYRPETPVQTARRRARYQALRDAAAGTVQAIDPEERTELKILFMGLINRIIDSESYEGSYIAGTLEQINWLLANYKIGTKEAGTFFGPLGGAYRDFTSVARSEVRAHIGVKYVVLKPPQQGVVHVWDAENSPGAQVSFDISDFFPPGSDVISGGLLMTVIKSNKAKEHFLLLDKEPRLVGYSHPGTNQRLTVDSFGKLVIYHWPNGDLTQAAEAKENQWEWGNRDLGIDIESLSGEVEGRFGFTKYDKAFLLKLRREERADFKEVQFRMIPHAILGPFLLRNKAASELQNVSFTQEEIKNISRSEVRSILDLTPTKLTPAALEAALSWEDFAIEPVDGVSFADTLAQDYDLKLKRVYRSQPQQAALNKVSLTTRERIALEVILRQAVSAAQYAGQGEGKDKKIADILKKEGDAAAVSAGVAGLEALAKAYGVRIIVIGNEGATRDGSAAMEILYDFNPEGKNGTFLFLNDSVEGTNYLLRGLLGGWSIIGLLDPKNSYSTDGYRISVNARAKRAPQIDPLITGENTVQEVFTGLAEANDQALKDWASNKHIVLLGGRDRHKPIEEQLKVLQTEQGLGFTVETFPDGDAVPRMLPGASGIPTQDGREIVVLAAGGANEHMLGIAAASLQNQPDDSGRKAFVVSRYITSAGLNDNLANADNFPDTELLEFLVNDQTIRERNLPVKTQGPETGVNLETLQKIAAAIEKHQTLAAVLQAVRSGEITDLKVDEIEKVRAAFPELRESLKQIQTETSVVGKAAVGGAAITGARPIDAGQYQNALQGVTFYSSPDSKAGEVEVSAFLIGEDGKPVLYRFVFETGNLADTRLALVQKTDPKYFVKGNVLYGLLKHLKPGLDVTDLDAHVKPTVEKDGRRVPLVTARSEVRSEPNAFVAANEIIKDYNPEVQNLISNHLLNLTELWLTNAGAGKSFEAISALLEERKDAILAQLGKLGRNGFLASYVVGSFSLFKEEYPIGSFQERFHWYPSHPTAKYLSAVYATPFQDDAAWWDIAYIFSGAIVVSDRPLPTEGKVEIGKPYTVGKIGDYFVYTRSISDFEIVAQPQISQRLRTVVKDFEAALKGEAPRSEVRLPAEEVERLMQEIKHLEETELPAAKVNLNEWKEQKKGFGGGFGLAGAAIRFAPLEFGKLNKIIEQGISDAEQTVHDLEERIVRLRKQLQESRSEVRSREPFEVKLQLDMESAQVIFHDQRGEWTLIPINMKDTATRDAFMRLPQLRRTAENISPALIFLSNAETGQGQLIGIYVGELREIGAIILDFGGRRLDFYSDFIDMLALKSGKSLSLHDAVESTVHSYPFLPARIDYNPTALPPYIIITPQTGDAVRSEVRADLANFLGRFSAKLEKERAILSGRKFQYKHTEHREAVDKAIGQLVRAIDLSNRLRKQRNITLKVINDLVIQLKSIQETLRYVSKGTHFGHYYDDSDVVRLVNMIDEVVRSEVRDTETFKLQNANSAAVQKVVGIYTRVTSLEEATISSLEIHKREDGLPYRVRINFASKSRRSIYFKMDIEEGIIRLEERFPEEMHSETFDPRMPEEYTAFTDLLKQAGEENPSRKELFEGIIAQILPVLQRRIKARLEAFEWPMTEPSSQFPVAVSVFATQIHPFYQELFQTKAIHGDGVIGLHYGYEGESKTTRIELQGNGIRLNAHWSRRRYVSVGEGGTTIDFFADKIVVHSRAWAEAMGQGEPSSESEKTFQASNSLQAIRFQGGRFQIVVTPEAQKFLSDNQIFIFGVDFVTAAVRSSFRPDIDQLIDRLRVVANDPVKKASRPTVVARAEQLMTQLQPLASRNYTQGEPETMQEAQRFLNQHGRSEVRVTTGIKQPAAVVIDLPRLNVPEISAAARSAVLRTFTPSNREAVILEESFVRRGGLAFAHTLFNGPVVVLTTDPKIIAQVNAFNQQFPNQLPVQVADSVKAARQTLREQIKEEISLRGGMKASLYKERAVLGENYSHEVWAELIRELGRPQVTIFQQGAIDQMAGNLGIAGIVEQLKASLIPKRFA